jgi:hypothetical protein
LIKAWFRVKVWVRDEGREGRRATRKRREEQFCRRLGIEMMLERAREA